MVDFKRFPHRLDYWKPGSEGDSVQDDEGNWIPGSEPDIMLTTLCRAEPNGAGKTTKGENGDLIVYDFLIYAPPGVPDLLLKATVKFYNQNNVLISEATIKRFDTASRLNTRIWV